GRSHWSLSVELDAQAWRITFDAAVRLKELPARLGSAYRTMVAARADSAGALILAVDGLAVRVEATVFPNQPPGTPAAKLRATDDGLAIWLEPAGLRLPCTVRWGYTITRIDESD
ncbi:MAG: hypothetical protein K8T25_16890, partial [Planctomycetia bacterium]|nr:hypothetical protein [Planctomycetia bacterium]